MKNVFIFNSIRFYEYIPECNLLIQTLTNITYPNTCYLSEFQGSFIAIFYHNLNYNVTSRSTDDKELHRGLLAEAVVTYSSASAVSPRLLPTLTYLYIATTARNSLLITSTLQHQRNSLLITSRLQHQHNSLLITSTLQQLTNYLHSATPTQQLTNYLQTAIIKNETLLHKGKTNILIFISIRLGPPTDE